jgi:hypothetical protein
MRDADAESRDYRTDGTPTGAGRLRVLKMRVCDERLGVKRDGPPDGSGRGGTRRCCHRTGLLALLIAGWSPKSANYVTLITDGRGAGLYIGDMLGRRGEHVMTWTSDRAGVVLYTVLGMIIVLSSIYIPA